MITFILAFGIINRITIVENLQYLGQLMRSTRITEINMIYYFCIDSCYLYLRLGLYSLAIWASNRRSETC